MTTEATDTKEAKDPAQSQTLLLVALEPALIEQVKTLWPGNKNMIEINTLAEVETLMDNLNKYQFCATICGSNSEEINPNEIAQVFRVMYTNKPIFFMTSKKAQYSKKEYKGNGFTDVFISPFDTAIITTEFNHILGIAEELAGDRFAPVRLVDLEPNIVLDFNVYVYLPVNQKHVRLVSAGQSIDEVRLNRLVEHSVSSIYIIREELPKFYKNTADRLKAINASAMTETEKHERMQGTIRELFSSIFDNSETKSISSGKEMKEHCEKIITEFVFDEKGLKFYKKLKNAIAASDDAYSHSLSVSTFAAMFAIGTKRGSPDQLALAGLFHDLGLVEVPEEVQLKSEEYRAPEERQQYEAHPDTTINLIREKKVVLSEECINAILEHHERYDGTGYPKKRRGERISDAAQVLSFADKFDYITRIEPGKPYISPLNALKVIESDPGAFSPQFLSAIKQLFKNEE